MKNTTFKNLFLSAVAVSTLASCQKDFYLEDLEDSQKVVASLEFTNGNLTAEIALLERNIDAAHYTITQNETAIAGLEGDNAALTIENDILKAIIEGLEASIYVLEELLKEKDDAILVLDSSSTTYQTEVTNLTTEREVLLVQMNDNSAELADAINKIYALEVLILAQADTIVTLEFENEALRAEVEALRAQLAGAGAGVDTSSEALAAVQAELDAANNEILSLTGTVSTTEAEVVNLQIRLDEALSAGSSDTTVIDDLREQLRLANGDALAYRNSLEDSRREVTRLTNSRDQLSRDLATRTRELADLNATITVFVENVLNSRTSEDDFYFNDELNSYYNGDVDGIAVDGVIYVSVFNLDYNSISFSYGGGQDTYTFVSVLDATMFFLSLGTTVPTQLEVEAAGGVYVVPFTI